MAKRKYAITKRNLNIISSNLTNYILEFSSINDLIKIKCVCKSLFNIITTRNIMILTLRKVLPHEPSKDPDLLRYWVKVSNLINREVIHRLKKQHLSDFSLQYIYKNSTSITFDHLNFQPEILGPFKRFFISEKCHVTEIGFAFLVISKETAEFISAVLNKNTNIKKFHLNNCPISNDHNSLFANMKNSTLEEISLDFHYNGLQGQFIKNMDSNLAIKKVNFSGNINHAILEMNEYIEKNCNIKELGLSIQHLPLATVNSIYLNKSIEILNLSNTSFTNDGFKTFVDLFYGGKKPKSTNSENKINTVIIKNVNMYRQQISKNLNRLFNVPNLTNIDISSNELLYEKVTPAFRNLSDNTILKKLNLSKNYFGTDALGELAEGLVKNTTLTHLDFSFNKAKYITDSLLTMLRDNKALLEFNLEKNGFSEDAEKKMLDFVKAKRSNFNLKIKSQENNF